MDADMYIEMLQDKHFFDLKKMEYIYSKSNVQEMLRLLGQGSMKFLPLTGFLNDSNLVYIESKLSNQMLAARALMSYRGQDSYGFQALTDEIISTFSIENINTSRDSVRKVLQGGAPTDEAEHRILGMKQGFEFIVDNRNKITAESLRRLYEIVVNPYLKDEKDQLEPGQLYRHGDVSVVDESRGKIIHSAPSAHSVPGLMNQVFSFIDNTKMDDLSKAATLHFCLAYIHPYFDGNGRMARMLHLWYLLQKGYSSALFMPFSSLIQQSKDKYYKAYELVENNAKVSGVLDLTPFLSFFNDHVYSHIADHHLENDCVERFNEMLKSGQITEKEKDLFHFVLSHYGMSQFSTKQLERDFGNSAYATIRSFVLKLSQAGLFEAESFGGNRVKYRLALGQKLVEQTTLAYCIKLRT